VLDEDQQTRDMLREYLEGQGMHVIAVANGTELRQLVAQEPIDAVILDVMARGEDSLGLLREMAEQPGTPPVMLLSAVASDIDRIVGLELGADDYMAKPFNPRELLARLRVVLRRGHAASARCRHPGAHLRRVGARSHVLRGARCRRPRCRSDQRRIQAAARAGRPRRPGRQP
jgi:two-component system OmpR family response regulator